MVVVPSDRAKGRRLASGNGSRGTDRRGVVIVGVAVVAVALLAGVLGGGLLGREGTTSGVPNGSGSAGRSGGDAAASTTPSGRPDPLGGAELPLVAFFDPKTGDLKGTTRHAIAEEHRLLQR